MHSSSSSSSSRRRRCRLPVNRKRARHLLSSPTRLLPSNHNPRNSYLRRPTLSLNYSQRIQRPLHRPLKHPPISPMRIPSQAPFEQYPPIRPHRPRNEAAAAHGNGRGKKTDGPLKHNDAAIPTRPRNTVYRCLRVPSGRMFLPRGTRQIRIAGRMFTLTRTMGIIRLAQRVR